MVVEKKRIFVRQLLLHLHAFVSLVKWYILLIIEVLFKWNYIYVSFELHLIRIII